MIWGARQAVEMGPAGRLWMGLSWARALATALTKSLAISISSLTIGTIVSAQELQAFSTAKSEALPAPWRLVGLPSGKAPLAQFEIATVGNEKVLKLATDKTYGTALHEVKPTVLAAGSTLKWRWRLEQELPLADLKEKATDDAAIKVCAMFDMPLDKLGFLERSLLQIARRSSAERLPAATLCYVWDHKLPVGSELPNAYSPRLRYVVLDSGEKQRGQWLAHERDLAADLQRAFGHEFDTPPPLVAIVVGADSDNTKGKSLAYLGDLVLSVKTNEIKKPE
jgi:hypothetical protein